MTTYVFAAQIHTPDGDPTDLPATIAGLIDQLRPADYTVTAFELTNVDSRIRPDGQLTLTAHADQIYFG
jgi:hypothetical protein